MTLVEVLRIPPGSVVTFHPEPRSACWAVGIVREITQRGGVLVERYDMRTSPPSSLGCTWVPYSRVLAHRPSRAGG